MPEGSALEDALQRCAQGTLPTSVAAMHLILRTETAARARAALAAATQCRPADEQERLADVARLLERLPLGFPTVRRLAREVEHAVPAGDAIAHWSHLFDRLVAVSPEASVALYSLGDAGLLATATQEIVAALDRFGVLDAGGKVLDVGCGIGRLETVLAPRVAQITGADVSRGMLEVAELRCSQLRNVSFVHCSGRDLAFAADARFDLVVFIDSFPYVLLAEAGLAARLLAECARVLRPGGALAICNFSYRGDAAADASELAALAARTGLEITRNETRPCGSWDAPAFLLRR